MNKDTSFRVFNLVLNLAGFLLVGYGASTGNWWAAMGGACLIDITANIKGNNSSVL